MNEETSQTIRKGYLWPAIKLLLFCVVIAFVIKRAFQIWQAAPADVIEVHAVWLIPASLAYLVGWLPSMWFWAALLKQARQPIPLGTAVRAYYVSQLGKYVPGKALVLVIRGAMAKDSGVDPILAGLMAAYETLVFMAAGTALWIASAPWAFGTAFWSHVPAWLRVLEEHRTAFAIAVLLVTFATTPVSAWIFTKLSQRAFSRSENRESGLPRMTAVLVSQGVVATSLGWLFNALSLGFVLQSVSNQPFDLSHFPVWLGATTFSIVGGFVVLIAPGGLGVREGLLIESLQDHPEIGPAMAIVAAALLRAVWFASEIVAAAVLYVVHRRVLRHRENS